MTPFAIVLFLLFIFIFKRTSVFGYVVRRFLGQNVRVQSVGWKCLLGIEVDTANGLRIQMHSLHISFFPPHCSKPILITLTDVRVERKGSDGSTERRGVSPTLLSLIQYVAVHVDRVHVVLLDAFPGCMMHMTMDGIRWESFRGPRTWQLENTCGLCHGKVVSRTSPFTQLLEFNTAFSLSLDFSGLTIHKGKICVDDPRVSVSHEAMGMLISRAPSSSPTLPATFSVQNMQFSVSGLSFRYVIELDGSFAFEVKKNDDELCTSLGEVSLLDHGRRGTIRGGGTAIVAQLSSRNVRVETGEISSTLVSLDVVQWLSVYSSFRSHSSSSSPSLSSSSSSLPSLSPWNIAVEVRSVATVIVSPDCTEWHASANVLSLTRSDTLEVAIDSFLLTRRACDSPSFDVHYWGDCISLGAAIFQYSSSQLLIGMDECKVEWNEEVLAQIGILLKTFQGGAATSPRSLSVRISSHRLLLICSAKSTYSCVKMESCSANVNEDAVEVILRNTKAVMGRVTSESVKIDSILKTEMFHIRPREEDTVRIWDQQKKEALDEEHRRRQWQRRIVNVWADMGEVRLTGRTPSWNLQLSGKMFLAWSPLLHSFLLHLFQFTKTALGGLSPPSPRNGSSKVHLALVSEDAVTFDLELSNHHLMRWSSPVLQLELLPNRELVVMSPALTINMDHVQILQATDVCISRSLCDGVMDALRVSTGGLETKSNKLWSWTADTLHFNLPYEFNFADVFDQFVTAVKWVKVVHGKKKGRPENPEVAADLVVSINHITFQMEDDPFEVRLRNIHELREDEVFECERRRQMLADRILNLHKTFPMITKAKIDELHDLLTKRNSEIYISRCSQLMASHPPVPLFTCHLTQFVLRALADESMRTDESLIRLIQILDPASPLPSSISFSTLWGRSVSLDVESGRMQFRDYPLPYMQMQSVHVLGLIAAAEREDPRSIRESTVHVPPPWTTIDVHRNLSPLKLFHDLQCETESFHTNYGPCWEPCLSMLSLNWNNISAPSRDPSPFLPFWDKMRLLFHGRLLWSATQMKMNILSSLDPYNAVETVELVLDDLGMEWVEGDVCIRCALRIFLRTASMYDDLCVVSLPHLKYASYFIYFREWNCTGNSSDHHSVLLCAPHKLPDSSTEHDSYRSFRSTSLCLNLAFVVSSTEAQRPEVLIYNNTIRCMHQLLLAITTSNRNVRRGSRFGTHGIKKKQLSKHLRNVRMTMDLPLFRINYRMSRSTENGLGLLCDRVEVIGNLTQAANAGATHRKKLYQWHSEHISATLGPTQVSVFGDRCSAGALLFSLSRVVYMSEKSSSIEIPLRRVTLHDLRAQWAEDKREACLAIAEGARRSQLLRNMLSLYVLQLYKRDEAEKKEAVQEKKKGELHPEDSPDMLAKLFDEADTKRVAHCEAGGELPSHSLQGVVQSTANDVLSLECQVELLNSQLLLRGESSFVLVSASRATLTQKTHKSVCRNSQLLSKRSWSALLTGMQYFGPVKKVLPGIHWLPRCVIEDPSFHSSSVDAVHSFIGGGDAVGGLVQTESGEELQRIVSRCSCQMYWCSYVEDMSDPTDLEDARHADDDAEAVDCLTLKHNMMEASTNPSQYENAVDIVNELLLFVDPKKKENAERRSRLSFECRQLKIEEVKRSIEKQLDQLREVVCVVRALERQLFHVESDDDGERKAALLADIDEYKRRQLDGAEQLAITISVLKQRQVDDRRVGAPRQEDSSPVVRKFEVCFEDCAWKLTSSDGQLGIAQLHIRNFLYTRTMRIDNSGEHLFEVGTIRITNLLPNSPYKDTIHRDEHYMSRDAALRVLCRHLAPVGGINVKEHFEVNIAPMVVQLTYRFFDKMMEFFFPGKNTKNEEELDAEGDERILRRLSLTRRITEGLPKRSNDKKHTPIDDIDKMRLRADANHFFLYIKIPEVPFIVSYKGNKQKNIEDVHQLNLQFPLCEFHEKNWTWLDLSLAVKQRCRRILIQQFMKQKLLRNRKKVETEQANEEDKKRIAMGTTGVEKPK